ncbi:protocadherin beta-9-like [Phyllopteryx taeniolatus]|uniref:protocadherin beta-9-like n=1 Tax=Phyllopteryx taeniolatus TaxID=161469 RepID=UPI002AD39DAC|nr:protocadherin beta-9-like [Phyllopteryx taeniolatus]
MERLWMRAVRGRWRTLFVVLCLCELRSVSGQARYSIPEEQAEGSFVGNIARDLGLDVARLVAGKARIISKGGRQYVDFKPDKGTLVIQERIDREELCGKTTPCSFTFDIILENPIQLYPVRILIRDQNDNAPQVLYPVQPHAEMVPRSADAGYLVTKVVAVDVDSGQNAWLSYKVQHKFGGADRGALFEVGLHNGEMRTVRQVTDKDAVKQRLTVVVEDNGQPSRSATVAVNVALADGFSEVLRSEFADDFSEDYDDRLTFYLVSALAAVSFLFVACLLLIVSLKVYRWRRSRVLYRSDLPVIPYYPPRYCDTLGTAGTLPHVYNYEACAAAKSHVTNTQAVSQSLVSVDGADADVPHGGEQTSGNCSRMSTLCSSLLCRCHLAPESFA